MQILHGRPSAAAVANTMKPNFYLFSVLQNYSLKASWCAEQLFKPFEKIPRRSTVLSDIPGKISISEVSYRILFSVVFFYVLFYLHGVIHDQSCTITFQLALVHSSRPQTNTTGILPRMTRAQCQKVQSDLLYTRASKHSIDRPISAAKLYVFNSVTQISTYLRRSKNNEAIRWRLHPTKYLFASFAVKDTDGTIDPTATFHTSRSLHSGETPESTWPIRPWIYPWRTPSYPYYTFVRWRENSTHGVNASLLPPISGDGSCDLDIYVHKPKNTSSIALWGQNSGLYTRSNDKRMWCMRSGKG